VANCVAPADPKRIVDRSRVQKYMDFSFKTWMYGVGPPTALTRAVVTLTRLSWLQSRFAIAVIVLPHQSDAADAAVDAVNGHRLMGLKRAE
jgi:hypothetical protein